MSDVQVFYDQSRRSWVVQYGNRSDRQSHFGSNKVRAVRHAESIGWTPPVGWVGDSGMFSAADVADDED